MELPDWLTNLLIILALILIIGLILVKFYPESFNKTITIFDEVFGITLEQKKAENLTEAVLDLQKSIKTCLDSGLEDCSCGLNLNKLPEGYYIKLQNTEQGIAIAAFTNDFTKISETLIIEGLTISLAETKEFNHIITESCNKQDITITKNNGLLGILSRKEFYPFLAENIKGIPFSILKEKNLCLYTEKFDIPTESSKAELFLSEVLSSYACNTKQNNSYYSLSWPINPNNIEQIKDCIKQYDNAFGITLNVKSGSEIINPFKNQAMITSTCVNECDNGPFLTLSETYLTGTPTGRYVIIKYINSIAKNLKTNKDHLSTELIKHGELLGTSNNEIEYIIGFNKSLTSIQIEPEKIYCELPHLNYNKYIAQDCKPFIDNIIKGCSSLNLFNGKNILNRLMQRLQNLKNDEKGKTSLIFTDKFIENVRLPYFLLGFSKDQEEIQRSIFLPNIKRPKQCQIGQACLCYCRDLGCLNPKTSFCKNFNDKKGFSPSFIIGTDYEEGVKIGADELLTQLYYKRKGHILYLCSEENKRLCL